MIRLYSLVALLFLFTSCVKNQPKQANSGVGNDQGITLKASNSPFNLMIPEAQFYKNVKYGPFDRNVFDIFLPHQTDPAGLAIFYHGGGFIGGDKAQIYTIPGYQNFINFMLYHNIAVASVNYQFLKNNETEGVLKCMNDSKRALQYMRFYADDLNINKEKVVLMGNSAGAGTSLWIGLNEDMADLGAEDKILRESTRVKGIVAAETQGTYDILKWHETVFSEYAALGFNFEVVKTLVGTPFILKFYGINNLSELQTQKLIEYRASVDYIDFLTADDPELFLDNAMIPNVYPTNNNAILHHLLHSKVLMDKANEVGVPTRVYLPAMGINTKNGEEVHEFVLRKIEE